MLYPLRDALLVKQMFARRFLGFAGEAVRELRSVVGQYLGDLEGRSLVYKRRKKSVLLLCVWLG